MQMLPKEKQPVAGSEGAQYRKKQLAKQLPAHDQDPSKCHELSPNEVKQMEQFVKKYKTEALGVGDVKLPGEVETKATDKNNVNSGDRSTSAAVGAMEDKSADQKASQYVSIRKKRQSKKVDYSLTVLFSHFNSVNLVVWNRENLGRERKKGNWKTLLMSAQNFWFLTIFSMAE